MVASEDDEGGKAMLVGCEAGLEGMGNAIGAASGTQMHGLRVG